MPAKGRPMKFRVVTTTNAKGWEATGRRMAESFLARWPVDASLTVYAEGFDPDIAGIDVRRLPAWMDEFKALHGKVPSRNGILPGGRYTYTHDCVRFAHKVAAVTDFGKSLSDGVMIWLDADVYTHADVTAAWLEKLFPAPSYIAWLDRQNSHPECGWVMYRCDHGYHHAFMEALENVYTSGDVFKYRETHDSFVLQQFVGSKVLRRKIEPAVSLSGAGYRTSHVFINGPIGAVADHMKGERKRDGRSSRRDLIIRRTEPYWQQA